MIISQLNPLPILNLLPPDQSYLLINSLVTEHRGSTPLTPMPATGHDYEPAQSTAK
jgi:hypothetical protein